MIAYVETAPRIEGHNGDFLVAFDSGGDEIKLLLSRHALFKLAFLSARASREANGAEPPVPFRRVCRKR